MRQRLMVIAAAMTALLMIAATAFAAETATTDGTTHDGVGAIWAKGKGTAILDGKGKVRMAIKGDVVIVDRAGDARVHIRAVPEPDGTQAPKEALALTTTYTLDNFRGVVWVKGTDFRIEAEGKMKFKGRGKGSVTLDGRGVWRTRRAHGTWGGLKVKFGGADVADNT